MKKFAVSLLALAAVSTAALAARNNDLRDQDTYVGKFNSQQVLSVESLAVPADGTTIFYGRYGSTMDADEVRRWDEKNG
jgi:hypothetical protein